MINLISTVPLSSDRLLRFSVSLMCCLMFCCSSKDSPTEVETEPEGPPREMISGTVTVQSALAAHPVYIGEIGDLGLFSNSGDVVQTIDEISSAKNFMMLPGGSTSRPFTYELPEDHKTFGTLFAWLDQNQNGILDGQVSGWFTLTEPARLSTKEIQGAECTINFWGWAQFAGSDIVYTVGCEGAFSLWDIALVGTSGFNFGF